MNERDDRSSETEYYNSIVPKREEWKREACSVHRLSDYM